MEMLKIMQAMYDSVVKATTPYQSRRKRVMVLTSCQNKARKPPLMHHSTVKNKMDEANCNRMT